MSNPNTDRDERVEEIRQRHLRVDCYKSQMRADIDYLLSLLDSQAAERRCQCAHSERDHAKELHDRTCNVLGCYCNRFTNAPNDAATRMRDRCVEKVEEYRRRIQYEKDEGMREALFGDMVIDLQSMPLVEGETND